MSLSFSPTTELTLKLLNSFCNPFLHPHLSLVETPHATCAAKRQPRQSGRKCLRGFPLLNIEMQNTQMITDSQNTRYGKVSTAQKVGSLNNRGSTQEFFNS